MADTVFQSPGRALPKDYIYDTIDAPMFYDFAAGDGNEALNCTGWFENHLNSFVGSPSPIKAPQNPNQTELKKKKRVNNNLSNDETKTKKLVSQDDKENIQNQQTTKKAPPRRKPFASLDVKAKKEISGPQRSNTRKRVRSLAVQKSAVLQPTGTVQMKSYFKGSFQVVRERLEAACVHFG